jgi:hypothetical protein
VTLFSARLFARGVKILSSFHFIPDSQELLPSIKPE